LFTIAPMLDTTPKIIQGRDFRLDLLRAVAICLVLLWHIQPFNFEAVNSSADWLHRLPQYLVSGFNQQFTFFAVPTFCLVSLYLFYSHISFSYFKRRMARLAVLYVVWTVIQFIAYFVVGWFGNYFHWRMLAEVSLSPVLVILQGGPPLPQVSDSVFYYFFILLILTGLAFLYAGLKPRVRLIVGLVVVVGSLVYFEIMNLNWINIPYWRIDNFIIYVPIAYVLRQYSQITKYWYIFLGLLFLLLFHNYLTLAFLNPSSAYGRVSLVFGTVTLFCLVFRCRPGAKNRIVDFLAVHSLGLFSVHKYFQLFFIVFFAGVFSILHLSRSLEIFNIEFSLLYFVIALFAILFSMVFVHLAARTRFREYVR
jgi:hypothetical protein